MEREYWSNGNLKQETSTTDGIIMCIKWFENGDIKEIKSLKDNKLHREDGPAFVTTYPNGNVEFENWYFEGELHRRGGPALIHYESNGILFDAMMFIHGQEIKGVRFIEF